ncbi:hypothetical protein K503DRAFT_774485 [Rhizopogon vinicolor AM-OR11-026]|uniref:F-box domain-containing protein n=1 Tax=Rhizopogon vinicolor AM-OR11-026 TaxID=1314800 RepID=A0A1B7MPF8_9AGAM|nr:hypothetical protein K503DRAFT_774485 [Rhizopogon vinicolor AM-OR11-026]
MSCAQLMIVSNTHECFQVLDLDLQTSKSMNRPTFRSISPILPVETLEFIFSHLERHELIPVLGSSSLFHNTASRVLYRAVTETSSVRAVQLIKTLASNNTYPKYVRFIDLDFANNIITANLLHLLRRVLQRVNLLTTLILDFSVTDNTADVAWIFEGCSFSLTSFTSSMRCDRSLARFLATQPRITELSLRGFDMVYDFELEPMALPKLEHFRTVMSCPDIIREVLKGRPVQSVSMSLHSGDVNTSLDSLLLSATAIKRLTVMSFESEPPITLLPLIADRLPQLEAFHLVVLMTNYTQEILLELSASLAQFKALKYLTFMAPSVPTSFNDERSIAEAWSKACPTLQTIILPKGLVWFQRDENWACLRDSEDWVRVSELLEE